MSINSHKPEHDSYPELIGVNKVQSVYLELLDIITQLCKAHNLCYWLDGGTLLGAARHGGFIPWDDDLDICLPYSDYLKLIELLKQFCKNSDKYMLYYGESGISSWADYFADTAVLADAVLPVRIDLIPIKLIPNTNQAVKEHLSLTNVAMIWNMGKAKKSNYILEEHRKWMPIAGENLSNARDSFFNWFLDTHKSDFSEITRYEDWLIDYSFGDAYVSAERKPIPLSWIFPLSSIEFEGRVVNAPGQVDTYLTNLYGSNFMQPPPKEKQKPALLTVEDSPFSKTEVMELLSLRRNAVFYNLALDAPDPEKARQRRRKISFLIMAARLLLRGKFSMMAAITRHAWLYFRYGVK